MTAPTRFHRRGAPASGKRRAAIAPLHRLAALAVLVPLALAMLAPTAQAQPADWPLPGEIEAPPLEVDPPETRREVLSNGMIVHLAEDRSLPLVSGIAYAEAPSLYDPEDRVGLAGLTAGMLREGGAGGRAPAALDATLERLAASVEAGSSDVLTSVSFSALSDTLEEVLPIWRDVLIAPDFDPARLEILRGRQLEAIRRVVDDPVSLALREFTERVAAGHPAGRSPSEATVSAVARDDLTAFHDAHYGPATTALALAGDFDADAMLARLEALFGGWDHEVEPPPELPPFDATPEPRIYLADRDLQQSVLIVGLPAMRAYQGPYAAFTVANEVLGAGGFGSRLFTEIRTRRGLAYATGSQLSQGFEVPGIFLAYAFTRADATVEVLELLLAEIERLVAEPMSAEELERAVTTLVTTSVFRDASIAAVAQREARVELLGLEDGYFERYLETIQDLDVERVRQAAAEVLDPDGLVVLVLGDADAFDRPLDELGEVERIELP